MSSAWPKALPPMPTARCGFGIGVVGITPFAVPVPPTQAETFASRHAVHLIAHYVLMKNKNK